MSSELGDGTKENVVVPTTAKRQGPPVKLAAKYREFGTAWAEAHPTELCVLLDRGFAAAKHKEFRRKRTGAEKKPRNKLRG